MMVGHFIEVNADKNKVIVLGGEKELECEIHADGVRLEQAYDTTWKRGVLHKLFSLGFCGHLPIFIRH